MEWIPLNKELPEEYKFVLVSFYENETYNAVNIAFRIENHWYLRLDKVPITLPLNAWMPLPEPYKGEIIMREPSRINIFCGRLAAIWQKVPDWRFGQLISNAFNAIHELDRDPFYIEDEEMIKYLEDYMKELLND